MTHTPQQLFTVRKALIGMDKANDDLWSADGLPRVGAVKQATGDQSVTRAMISEALPGFNRAWEPEQSDETDETQGDADADTDTDGADADELAVDDSIGDGAADTPPETPETPEGQQPVDGGIPPADVINGGGDNQAGDDANETDPGGTQPNAVEAPKQQTQADVEAERAARIAEIDQMVSELQIQRDEIGAQIDELHKTRNVLYNMGAPKRGHKADQLARMEVIKRSNQLRAEKHAARSALLKNVDMKSVNFKSPLDQAMARKTQRGTQRPPAQNPR